MHRNHRWQWKRTRANRFGLRRGRLALITLALAAFFVLPSGISAAGAYETQVFEEDFSGELTDQWKPYGSPRPVIVDCPDCHEKAFKNNGDANYRSGAVTKETFDYSNFLVIEMDYRVSGYNTNGCWVGNTTGLLTDYNYHDSLSPGFSVVFSESWAGAMCRSGDREGVVGYSYLTASGGRESVSVNPMNDFIGDWHRFSIWIDESNHVRFLVDGRSSSMGRSR